MPKETYQKEELNRLTSDEKDTLILGMQDEILSLKKNYEQLMEQFRVFEQQRFGRHTEKLDQIDPSGKNEKEEAARQPGRESEGARA